MTTNDNKTHHKSSGSSVMTIPKLRKSFEHMEGFASNASNAEQLRKEWKKVFGGKGITEEQAVSYLNYIKENKNQAGGSAQAGGSPGLYSSSNIPGQSIPGGYTPYGNFLEYQMKGFDIGVPQNSQAELCGKVDTTPTLLPNMGSNIVETMKGGYKKGKKSTKRKSTDRTKKVRSRKYSDRVKTRKLKGGTRFPVATNPTSVWQDAFTALRGQPLGASPSATDPIPNRLFHVPSPYNIQVSEINRTMSNDIRSV